MAVLLSHQVKHERSRSSGGLLGLAATIGAEVIKPTGEMKKLGED